MIHPPRGHHRRPPRRLVRRARFRMASRRYHQPEPPRPSTLVEQLIFLATLLTALAIVLVAGAFLIGIITAI